MEPDFGRYARRYFRVDSETGEAPLFDGDCAAEPVRVRDAPDDAAEWGRRMQAKVLTEFDRTVVANRLIEVLRSVV